MCRNDDLLVTIDQRIERVEELFLCAVLAGDELDIIDHQNIDSTENLFEIHHLAVAQGLHEPVHELFCRKVDHVQIGALGLQFPCDSMHQVRLAQADTTVEEQRVERHRAAFGDAASGGMGQFVRLAHNETVKGKALVQRRARQLVYCGGRTGRRFWRSDSLYLRQRAFSRRSRNPEMDTPHRLPRLRELMEDQIPEIL